MPFWAFSCVDLFIFQEHRESIIKYRYIWTTGMQKFLLLERMKKINFEACIAVIFTDLVQLTNPISGSSLLYNESCRKIQEKCESGELSMDNRVASSCQTKISFRIVFHLLTQPFSLFSHDVCKFQLKRLRVHQSIDSQVTQSSPRSIDVQPVFQPIIFTGWAEELGHD